ncbi:hypothetical protein GUJ93_ZPchr0007g5013 [Zizania palustris]|uniref:RING-type E3 ubiquitin transferase n=1 Tax=Zizania palustris TaxID=103762 RepID=A0A8J5VMJ0_ZIZPA|nr:hypothetical protein GUJ93_ZPchr0007g5013 [Zizania palustris]
MAMAPPKSQIPCTYHLSFVVFLCTTTTLSMAVSTSYSSHCSSPSPALDQHTDHGDALALLRSFQLSIGHFVGGGDNLFSPDDGLFDRRRRSLSFVPHGVSRTTESGVIHLTASLVLSGPRRTTYEGRHAHTISFVLDGYYSFTSSDLCMVGSGTDYGADGSMKLHEDVALRLRVPRPSKLTDPFVTGRLEGASFETISFVSYDESDSYTYSENVICPPFMSKNAMRGGAAQAFKGNFSCDQLRTLLKRSYKLEHMTSSNFGSQPRDLRMYINQVHCTASGAVRAYVEFSNTTDRLVGLTHTPGFMAVEDVAVADGYWSSATGQLCLVACPVTRSVSGGSSHANMVVHECKIKMSLWFLAVWTIHDRGIVTGKLWNASEANTAKSRAIPNLISVSGIQKHWDNLSDVKYNYTMVAEAKNHYLKSGLSNKQKNMKGSFPGNNTYSYHDFEFHFFGDKQLGYGYAYPVSIESMMVYRNRLSVNESFVHRMVVDKKNEILNVSYDIRHHASPENWVGPKNQSYYVRLHERRITAEGVYDRKRGILCMIGCREINGSTDCQVLITVQFASLDAKVQWHGTGVISSLRQKTDRLFFEKIDIRLYGMYTGEISEAISRMDMESMMLVISTTLSCVFTILQILHTKRNPEVPPATSITMLVTLALGYMIPLVLNVERMFLSRRKQYVPLFRSSWFELNEVMLRVPTLIASLLHLRLLQLAWAGRISTDQSKAEILSVAKRKALRICLSLYFLGGIIAGIIHAINVVRARSESPQVARISQEPATIWEDLASYAGLILDGFLLPQIILNLFSGSRVRAISPWFYIGVTMIRAMPHVHDVFRAHNYAPSLRSSYIYANPHDDLFSAAWDIIVPLGAVLLTLVLFLQQRLGGAFMIPLQRRRLGSYEMVSTM